MWIMAGDAGDPALDVTEALTKAVGVMIDLEALRARPARFIDIDVQDVVAEGLAGTERVIAAIESPHPDHGHSRLQMTLKTDRIAQGRRQPRRIDDGGANGRTALAAH